MEMKVLKKSKRIWLFKLGYGPPLDICPYLLLSIKEKCYGISRIVPADIFGPGPSFTTAARALLGGK